ncbi:GDP-mannose 4,6-dehydratase [Candidatus Woesearchaeota archaeon]|nr:GDP-mannose 4,6-dehydratase [Candidatus Woesearchaeota archaeon]
MNVLLTGGAGFIGSQIAEAYLNAGHKVIIVDNICTGKKEYIPKRAVFYRVSVLDDLSFIFKKHKIDVVNNHAAQINVHKSVQNPEYDATTNVMGTLNLLEHCREFKVKKFVFSSSAAVYGTPEKLPLTEEALLLPESPYGASKIAAEYYIKVYAHLYKMDYCILRYANVYGPRQDASGEGGVIAIFLDRMNAGAACTIYGDGKQTRDFVYVKDIVSANLAALTGGCGVFNIGTGKTTTVNALFTLASRLTSYKKNPMMVRSRDGDIRHSYFSINKAKKGLGWKPAYSLDAGLHETAKWFKGKVKR